MVFILLFALLFVCVIKNYKENNYFKKSEETNNNIKENSTSLINLDENSSLYSTNYVIINDIYGDLIQKISETDSIENLLKKNKIHFELSTIDVTTPKFKNEKEKSEYISDKLMIKIMQRYGLGSKILNKEIIQKSNIIKINYSLAFINHNDDNYLKHEFYTLMIPGKKVVFWERCKCE